MKRLVLMAIAILPVSVSAQDYDPAMAAHESMSQQQFLTQRSRIDAMTLRRVIERNRGRRAAPSPHPTRQQIAACNGKSRFRADFGANNPKVRRLYELCRSINR